MKVLKLKLSGKTAFFKKPDVNSYVYFTYGNIHKVALLGMFGAILGYGGYNQFRYKLDNVGNCEDKYPEFYSRLNNLKISIEPIDEKAFIPKKIQVFNNSVGYASQEMGGNLIVKEQWLENPKWNIYVLLDNEEAHKIRDYITNSKAIYQPYLGKNDHYADISEVEVYDDDKVLSYKTKETLNEVTKLNSLCPKSHVEFDIEDEFFGEEVFKYSERLPIELKETTNMYELGSFVYSNMYVKSIESEELYNINGKNIVFF